MPTPAWTNRIANVCLRSWKWKFPISALLNAVTKVRNRFLRILTIPSFIAAYIIYMTTSLDAEGNIQIQTQCLQPWSDPVFPIFPKMIIFMSALACQCSPFRRGLSPVSDDDAWNIAIHNKHYSRLMTNTCVGPKLCGLVFIDIQAENSFAISNKKHVLMKKPNFAACDPDSTALYQPLHNPSWA